ncbi:FMN-binding negative transcriptional regulator [Kribbella sp. NPDC006257]|uniref:FMN-binding negative transcriptional regulator n=1 Tax=Kribbella sp. NPDC006257 TaxID=3156738 RepID=UPI0033A2647C
MYVPKHFAADDAVVQDLLTNHGAANLITSTADGLLATFLPLIYDASANTLLGHVARNNPQWKTPALGKALAIVHRYSHARANNLPDALLGTR